jgi:hypothetical protein
MENESMLRLIGRLAIEGERAGFSVGEMIQLLEGGLSVETLLQLIEQRRAADEDLASPPAPTGFSRWIM